MPQGLLLEVAHGGGELTRPHGARVVPRGPLKRPAHGVPVAIRQPGARTLETLHQSREIVNRRKRYDHVNVLTHHPHRQRPSAIANGLLPEKPIQEVSDRGRDGWHPIQGGPSEMRVETGAHRPRMQPETRGCGTNRTRQGSIERRADWLGLCASFRARSRRERASARGNRGASRVGGPPTRRATSSVRPRIFSTQ